MRTIFSALIITAAIAAPAAAAVDICKQKSDQVMRTCLKNSPLYDLDPNCAPRAQAAYRSCRAKFQPGTRTFDRNVLRNNTVRPLQLNN